MLPMVRQMLQAMSSLKTNGVAARTIQVVPPMMVAISKPKPVASARLMAASPRTRIEPARAAAKRAAPVKSHARSMDGAGQLAVEAAR